MKKLVYGVGVNDMANQQILIRTPEGKVVRLHTDPIYLKWAGMLKRCYSPSWSSRFPSYSNCNVCESWLTFSTFKEWILKHCRPEELESYDLDKDLIIPSARCYSPETSVLIPRWLNRALVRRGEGKILTGVRIKNGKFTSQISVNGRKKYLGIFPTELSAHEAWKDAKHKEMIRLTELYSSSNIFDERVDARLREIIAKLSSPGIVKWLI